MKKQPKLYEVQISILETWNKNNLKHEVHYLIGYNKKIILALSSIAEKTKGFSLYHSKGL